MTPSSKSLLSINYRPHTALSMKLWQKLLGPKQPSHTVPTSDHEEAPQRDRTTTARTTSGAPIQRPLPSPSPYTTHPHITRYTPTLALSGPHTICRCALPTVHGDAFTRRHHASSFNGIAFLSQTGQPLTWEQAAHAMLDALGVDSRVSPGWHAEDEGLLRRVFCEETVIAIKRYHDVWEGVRRCGVLRCAVEVDVFWWGEVNPKGLVLRGVGELYGVGEVVTVNGPFYGGAGVRGRKKERGEDNRTENGEEKEEEKKEKEKDKMKRHGMFFAGVEEGRRRAASEERWLF